ncbi:zinc-ribbon domain-containing protein [Clostridium sp. DSM 100503]|uniref:zinc-ribbon domain-containing protein n=1 Tax=Clostridium sp. DSM 100503 TaxID=2963282 RepID=UPI00214A4123|nr:zinc ribbon domain-containing protein [Clostridium sp. DSM 100503]MCR1952212.1 zinc-ribbon domain-containing protein [Clostridium sp. DSM 100503]
MFCKNCGKEIDDKAVVCIHCGVSTNSVQDNGGFGWGVLGFCAPIVGIILYAFWKETKPKSSKAAGIGALISVGAGILFYVLMFIIGFLSY